jgi:septal ring factor EnvC (AmiA/AmiB activator)
MTLRLRGTCAASIVALVLAFTGCGGDDDKKDNAAQKYCKALEHELRTASESLEKCVDQVKNLTSKDTKAMQRELDKANRQLKNLPKGLKQDLREMHKPDGGK